MVQLIDTSVFIDLERRSLGLEALADALPDEPVALAAITARELLVGVHRADDATRRERRGAFVERLLGIVPVLPFDLEAARVHARLLADLLRNGNRVGAHDLIIAATALARDAVVWTGNVRDFGRIAGLRVEVPSF